MHFRQLTAVGGAGHFDGRRFVARLVGVAVLQLLSVLGGGVDIDLAQVVVTKVVDGAQTEEKADHKQRQVNVFRYAQHGRVLVYYTILFQPNPDMFYG